MKSSLPLLARGATCALALVLAACGRPEPGVPGARPAPERSSAAPATFSILAGSELKDVADRVVEFGRSKGVTVTFTYSASLDAVDRLMEPNGFDAVWLSHGKYVQLVPEIKGQVKQSEKTMYSRVVLGVKPDVAARLGFQNGKTGWKDVMAAADAGKFRFAMTNPTGSNTGFVTLVGVASELAGKGDALTEADIPEAALKRFFKGQSLTSGSSADLAERFAADPKSADGIVNYESVIKGLAARGLPLDVIIPKEGVVTADYPLMLLGRSPQQAFYEALVAHLRSDDVQADIARTTGRTPLKGDGSDLIVNELPFPGTVRVVDALLRGFADSYSRPARSFFVLDTSGSMDRDGRMVELKRSMGALAAGDGTLSGRFATFRNRETVSVATFSNEVRPAVEYPLGQAGADNAEVLQKFKAHVEGLRPDGGTAIYDALMSVYGPAQASLRKETESVSIVLLTDGENNNGASLKAFLAHVQSQGEPKVPVYAVLYGEANAREMQAIADATGGRVFDARKQSLRAVMKAIRSFQ